MFVHRVRHIVKPGEFAEFVEAFKALNVSAPRLGLPSYRLWATSFGDLNEVWAEAEYDSLDGHVDLWQKARSDTEVMGAFRTMLAHVVPGSVRDYPLQPVELT